ncbi:hypothetical protein ABW20_dc0104975 [Dactylellina cionopaga]|nr:hypothetical protein ABW20_dc0104975 [Dactylellina cionopaga]
MHRNSNGRLKDRYQIPHEYRQIGLDDSESEILYVITTPQVHRFFDYFPTNNYILIDGGVITEYRMTATSGRFAAAGINNAINFPWTDEPLISPFWTTDLNEPVPDYRSMIRQQFFPSNEEACDGGDADDDDGNKDASILGLNDPATLARSEAIILLEHSHRELGSVREERKRRANQKVGREALGNHQNPAADNYK